MARYGSSLFRTKMVMIRFWYGNDHVKIVLIYTQWNDIRNTNTLIMLLFVIDYFKTDCVSTAAKSVPF